MTVETDLDRAQYATNATTGPWTVSFYFLANDELAVTYTDATGVDTLLTLDVDYSVVGAGDEDGGTITTTLAYATGGQLVILRDVKFLQETEYVDGDSFPAKSHERALDRLTMIAQQLREMFGRAITFPASYAGSTSVGDLATRAGKLLGFDATTGALTYVTAASGSALELAAQYAGSIGSSLIGWSNGLAGGKIRTVQAKLREAPSFSDMAGVDITGVLDSTAAMQALITATNGPLISPPGAIFNVSAPLRLHSNIDIDLRGATINWTGAAVTSANKASRWDNSVFVCGAVAPGIQYTNVKVRNGTINCNNWGCAVFFKRVDGIAITDITTSLANCAGIAVLDCTDGEVKRNKLIDCAADPAQGFDPATDLEGWSDGIIVWYGSQAISIENNTVINTRVGTGRCGIVIDDASAGSAETLRKTSGNSIRNNTVQGYDRQVHVEQSNAITVESNTLTFVDSGSKTYSCPFIDWNTTNTVWLNNIMKTSKAFANISGPPNAIIIGGEILQTNPAYTGNLFFNVGSTPTKVTFRNVILSYGIGNANITAWNVVFEDCTQSASAWTQSDAYNGVTLRVVRGSLNNVCFSNHFGIPADRLEFDGVEFIGYGGANSIAATPAGTGSIYLRRVKLPAGPIQINCGTTITIDNMEWNTLPTITGSPLFTILNGKYQGSVAPTTGTWIQGQEFENRAAVSGGFAVIRCTGGGTPGTWKTYGLIS